MSTPGTSRTGLCHDYTDEWQVNRRSNRARRQFYKIARGFVDVDALLADVEEGELRALLTNFNTKARKAWSLGAHLDGIGAQKLPMQMARLMIAAAVMRSFSHRAWRAMMRSFPRSAAMMRSSACVVTR